MSWSLQLRNGDFTLNGASLGTVVDEYKLVQDLRCALLEQMGTDDMHPQYGSLIDGGTMPDGTISSGAVGLSLQQASAIVQSEIQRIALAYQNQQLNRAKSDRLTYNRVSLSPAEVLLSITSLNLTQEEDTLLVNVTLQTARGEDIAVVFPVLTNS